MDLHIDDAGGHDNTSEAQRSLIRRVSVLETELEFQETRLAEMRLSGQEPTEKQLDLYNRLAGNLRRLLESIGIERKARKVPSLHDVLSKSR
ncbi:MAG TPA: hypothetical protein VMR74_07305 [Gammaproteobacteria bacterium]|nr:hypothetical protein [Gammaproteobacteria bacterium]